ncbi:MAG: 50S ribosomal protein L11 methyltransferase [Prevotella sp.]|nr:50S ribosomal protein L11 methyltransferase [Prevotella sp.]
MKYYEVVFNINAQCSMQNAQLLSDVRDLLAALAGEAGFETFEETDTGIKGYVQQALFDDQALKEALEDFPFEGVCISYEVQEAEDRDWNEQWEQEGFEPIIIKRREIRKATGRRALLGNGEKGEICPAIVIHDGRHLPETESEISIEIDAKLAFGTGTHETTRMVVSALLSFLSPLTIPEQSSPTRSLSNLSPQRILDCGTGTGILAICALKLGAREAIGYDIDEWSVDNARHNAVINQVDDRFTSLLGDVSILNEVEGTFELVMANINRNILLADMPMMHEKMVPGAHLILSGFYTADIPLLTEKAKSLGMTLIAQQEDNDWACLVFRK